MKLPFFTFFRLLQAKVQKNIKPVGRIPLFLHFFRTRLGKMPGYGQLAPPCHHTLYNIGATRKRGRQAEEQPAGHPAEARSRLPRATTPRPGKPALGVNQSTWGADESASHANFAPVRSRFPALQGPPAPPCPAASFAHTGRARPAQPITPQYKVRFQIRFFFTSVALQLPRRRHCGLCRGRTGSKARIKGKTKGGIAPSEI